MCPTTPYKSKNCSAANKKKKYGTDFNAFLIKFTSHHVQGLWCTTVKYLKFCSSIECLNLNLDKIKILIYPGIKIVDE